MSEVRRMDDANFPAEVAAPGLLVIDFWAAWCGPCHALAPVIERLAKSYDGSVRVAKLNVDESPRTAARFGVRSIPSVLFFKDGAHVDTVVGLVPYGVLESFVESHLDAFPAEAGRDGS